MLTGWGGRGWKCWDYSKQSGDVIHERRKSTTKFTFAPSWRADYILYSNVMTQTTCSGGKIGQGEFFKEELSGIIRNRYMPTWCHAGSDSESVLQAFLVAYYVICTSCAFYLYFLHLCIVHSSLWISSRCLPKVTAKTVFENHLSVIFFIQRHSFTINPNAGVQSKNGPWRQVCVLLNLFADFYIYMYFQGV